ncbi:MAG TPA: glutathione S-transferase [Burkholderiales bacterium]|nr:glutathione S-transferase [Burkholderiales bacterium]
MKLWHSGPSPFARKVRICAIELGLAARIEEIAVTVAPNKPNLELARENPLIKVPALEAEDGSVLYDSRVICEYLDALAGGNRLFPAAGAARWQALRRQALGDGVMDAGILRRYELALRPEALRWADWLAGQQAKIDHGLDAAEREAGGWGEAFDIGHLTLACALGWLDFRFPDSGWRNARPQLGAWYARLSARPSLAQTTPSA